MKNKNLIYGIIIGVFIGILATAGFYMCSRKGDHREKGMTHQMADGTMMSNNDTGMKGMMDDMTKSLQGRVGNDLDKQFLAEMIVHHQGAVDMAKTVIVNSKRPELIKFANNIIAVQTKEITTMKGWQKAWFETQGKLKVGNFSGKLEQVNKGCFVDGECYVVIDKKHVTAVTGWSQETAGSVIGVESFGDLDNHIGEEFEVYAQDKGDGTYTLYGSEGFYIKLKK